LATVTINNINYVVVQKQSQICHRIDTTPVHRCQLLITSTGAHAGTNDDGTTCSWLTTQKGNRGGAAVDCWLSIGYQTHVSLKRSKSLSVTHQMTFSQSKIRQSLDAYCVLT